MFRSILVPVDGSIESAQAQHLATVIAAATRGVVHTLRPGVVEFSASRIAAAARSQGVDLIVIGPYGEDPLPIEPTTSLAQQILVQSPCPVFVAAPSDGGFERLHTLLVPVDGSPGGSLALAAAHAMAEACQGQIVLLDVVVPVPALASAALPGMTLGGFIDPDWEKLAFTGARDYLARVEQSLTEAGIQAESHVVSGEVGEEIVRFATVIDADAIVMSTHSAVHAATAGIGGVAAYVLRNARRPVLLVKREPRPE